MATLKHTGPSGTLEVEASDVAMVLAVLGVAAAFVATTWLVTRNPENLRNLAELALSKGVTLLEGGQRVLGR